VFANIKVPSTNVNTLKETMKQNQSKTISVDTSYKEKVSTKKTVFATLFLLDMSKNLHVLSAALAHLAAGLS
jgi:hypothetical protein